MPANSRWDLIRRLRVKRGLMKYCEEQEKENNCFVIKASWKNKIKRIQFLKLIVYFVMMVTDYILLFVARQPSWA